MVGLFFPFLLIISATLYAFKTRKCPGGFNETRPVLYRSFTSQ
jgi:metabotropic X receptor